ncbi:MAG: ester cyclase [Gaiellaceae bacterium]
MASSEAKRIAHGYLERVLDAGDLAALDELVTEDVVLYGGSGKAFAGRETLRELLAKMALGVRRTSLDVMCELAEGDTVVSLYTVRGVHVGEYYGVPATGRALTTTAVNVMRVEHGRIAEIQVFMDASELLRQLTTPDDA